MIVYHGSTMIVERPDVKHSYRPLDFGKGFYVTAVKEQAVRWARRKADIEKCDRAFISMYHSQIWDRDRALKEIRVYPNYDQTAFVTQTAIDKLLSYDSYEEVIL